MQPKSRFDDMTDRMLIGQDRDRVVLRRRRVTHRRRCQHRVDPRYRFPGWTGGVIRYINQFPGGVAGFVDCARSVVLPHTCLSSGAAIEVSDGVRSRQLGRSSDSSHIFRAPVSDTPLRPGLCTITCPGLPSSDVNSPPPRRAPGERAYYPVARGSRQTRQTNSRRGGHVLV